MPSWTDGSQGLQDPGITSLWKRENCQPYFECSGMDSTSKTPPTLNMQNIAREAEMIKRKQQGV